MKATHTLRSLIVLTLMGTLAGAQTPAKKPEDKKQEPAHAPKEQPKEVKEATAKPEPSRELSLTVSGLTKDNLSKVKDSLTGMASHSFNCDACKVEQATAGNCPKCQAPLKATQHTMFKAVTPSADTGMIALTLDPAATVRLSEVESALGKNSVKIDPAKMTLPGRSRLVVQGVTADAAPAIEKALTDAKLFDEVKTKFDSTTNELLVMVRAGASAPTRAKVSAAIEAAKGKLSDVVWAAMGAKA